MKKYRVYRVLSCILGLAMIVACEDVRIDPDVLDDYALTTPPLELIQQIESHPQLSCFAKHFKTLQLSKEVWNKGFTVFVPENMTDVDCQKMSVDELKSHIVTQILNKEELARRTSISTMGGESFVVTKWPGEAQGIRLNGIALNETSGSGDTYRFYTTERSLTSLPGHVVAYSAPNTQRYIGNPSICVLPNGDYLASHDFFGPGAVSGTSRIYRSVDEGITWTRISELQRQQVSTLFFHDNTLYILGLDRTGQVVIRSSDDEGVTWTAAPTTENNGLLFSGLYQTASSPIVVHNGRIWKALEKVTGSSADWARAFEAMVISAPVDADLLKRTNWTSSTTVPFDGTWLDGRFEGMLEGGVVLGADGVVRNMLRAHTNISGEEYAAVIRYNSTGTTADFNPTEDFVSFPGGSKKFTVRYDAESGKYWSLVNSIAPDQWGYTWTPKIRNTLALSSSADLVHWTVNKIVVNHPNVDKSGFQYVDWDFDGNDIVLLIRSSYDDGNSAPPDYHDANYLFFKRIDDFRQYKDKQYPYGPL
ncbi:exo-alpha-sialidase [Sphingobacterium sp. SGG-5]|uniref:sialidase family protein n=1 Tax=Sphingobacterium sp. SGG-5 TaxID=2710881 RepID=UPI0013EC3135|nr:sialidase family protein [Sphingobacterium sp. SGG-5]NGM60925.1 exo-alpha-sialidase [Sphingobacterium sp. SGG-5]